MRGRTHRAFRETVEIKIHRSEVGIAISYIINCYGFRGIKGAGASYNLPACGKSNVWININWQGRTVKSSFFVGDAIPSSLQKEQIIK